MKTKLCILALVLLAYYSQSCNSVDPDDPELNELLLSCQAKDPINDLQWLADLDEEHEKLSHRYRIMIVEFDRKGFIVLDGTLSSSPVSTIFNCNGDVAFDNTLREITYNDFIDNMRIVKVLKTKNWP
ncbi:hypothetical protein [Algoriphagus sp.]|uniref:hypothetical protein n=1 Tax=Algoriphagus sp. TaxID=1872435 RepID=UPI003F701C6B